jgi:hypothetical protein
MTRETQYQSQGARLLGDRVEGGLSDGDADYQLELVREFGQGADQSGPPTRRRPAPGRKSLDAALLRVRHASSLPPSPDVALDGSAAGHLAFLVPDEVGGFV